MGSSSTACERIHFVFFLPLITAARLGESGNHKRNLTTTTQHRATPHHVPFRTKSHTMPHRIVTPDCHATPPPKVRVPMLWALASSADEWTNATALEWRECPRGHASPDCSIPREEPDGRQTFTGTIESRGPWTLFAPDNAAFVKAPAAKAMLLAGFQGGQNAGYLDTAFDTLYYHVIEGNYSAAQLPSGETDTLLDADITTSHLGKHFTFVTGGITSNVARVKKSIEVTNGVVHIISAVLSPPADTRPSKQQGYSTCCAADVAQSCCDACRKAGNQCC